MNKQPQFTYSPRFTLFLTFFFVFYFIHPWETPVLFGLLIAPPSTPPPLVA